MQKFLLQCLFFGLVLLAINQLLYVNAKSLYFGNYSSVDTTASQFLLADSRGISLSGFPTRFGVANFSSNSDNYTDILRKVNYLVRHTGVKRIYISADDHMLSSYRERTNNQDISIVLTEAKDFEHYTQYFKERYLKYYVVLFQPVVRTIVRTKIESWVSKKLFWRSADTGIKNSSWEVISEQQKLANAVERYYMQFPDPSISPSMYGSLTEIIRSCKAHQVELIAIKFPLTKEYLMSAAQAPFHTDSIFDAHSIRVVDQREIFKDSSQFFLNQDHLNDLGGKRFSELLFGSDPH